jgi:hypothetical protein
LSAGDNPLGAILSFCRSRVAKMVRSVSSVQTVWDLEKIVCSSLNLVIHEIWTDEELKNLSLKYARDEGDTKFAALDMDLERPDTYGVIYQRNCRNENGDFQYVAFVDCRGEKHLRRFFTRWHEIAHCLTTYEQFELPFKRTNTHDIGKDPIEKLMDMIAGELGFEKSLFGPVLRRIQGSQYLNFEIIESVRQQYCPDASFHSTLNACGAHNALPVVLLEVGMSLKAAEKRAINDAQMSFLPERAPKPCLRVLRSMPNDEARKIGLKIHKSWRIPGYSVIAKVFNSDSGELEGCFENLDSWQSSEGESLGKHKVFIQARKIQGRVIAIVSLAA